jgi:DNA-directed RNA polymerase subunit RPC12/RpoP
VEEYICPWCEMEIEEDALNVVDLDSNERGILECEYCHKEIEVIWEGASFWLGRSL